MVGDQSRTSINPKCEVKRSRCYTQNETGTLFQWMVFRSLGRADGAPETVFSQAIPVVLHMTFY